MDFPPPQYDHVPHIPYVIKENQGGGIFAIHGPCFGVMGLACTVTIERTPQGVRCVIRSVGKMTPDLLRHEFGHCNGWKHDN